MTTTKLIRIHKELGLKIRCLLTQSLRPGFLLGTISKAKAEKSQQGSNASESQAAPQAEHPASMARVVFPWKTRHSAKSYKHLCYMANGWDYHFCFQQTERKYDPINQVLSSVLKFVNAWAPHGRRRPVRLKTDPSRVHKG